MRYYLVAILMTALAQPAKAPVFPEAGSDLPGPFYSFMATGKKKGKYHCLVTEHDLNPVVMVMVKGVEITEPLKYLLVKLDNAVDRNPNSRLASFFIFHSDKLKNLARDDILGNPEGEEPKRKIREEMEKKIEDIARDANLKHITLALDITDRLLKYKADTADVVVLLYNRYRVVSFHALKKDALTEAKAKEILGEVAKDLGARR